MQALLRLFHAVLVSDSASALPEPDITQSSLEKTLPYGFAFAPKVLAHYTSNDLDDLTQTVIETIGFSAEFANSSFHKSWCKIRDASLLQLRLEQLVHYMTTYGSEWLGIYDPEQVYIPKEALHIPDVTDDVPITIISGLSQNAIKQKLLSFLTYGIALHETTVRDLTEVALHIGLSLEDIQAIRNKEVRAALYDLLETVPENPTEFLRYVIFKATGQSLLIKNRTAIQAIQACDMAQAEVLFGRYESIHSLESLASIFHRFKPLFLAFKGSPKLKTKINKLRKLATRHHKPMAGDYLNEITGILKHGDEIRVDRLIESLTHANTFRKIRLAYALQYRTLDAESIVYKVRNNKGYATEFHFDQKDQATTVLQIVLDSIVEDVSHHVRGRTIYIPSYMNYALPATEKQFTGMIPSGSFVSMSSDMIVGIHWMNQGSHRIDLDLALIDAHAKYGWDAQYRGDRILFSGDMTDAPEPNGASELFYIGTQLHSYVLLTVNYYNYNKDLLVPITLFVGQEKRVDLPKNYMMDPNHLLAQAQSVINRRQSILGLVLSVGNETRFYFHEFALGNAASSSHNQMTMHARRYLISYATHPILLNDILTQAGAEITRVSDGCDLDLSPQTLDKAKLVSLFS